MKTKTELRKLYSSVKKGISATEKNVFDNRMLSYFLNSRFYRDFETFLVYVSVNDEIDTLKLIDYLLENRKVVAVPYCINKTMFFCRINSLDELTAGKFGIPTVMNPVFTDDFVNEKSVCVVPALSIDKNGNRLGYGGGYYDRFLSVNNIETVAFCYERCLTEFLPYEEFDIPVKNVITENRFIEI